MSAETQSKLTAFENLFKQILIQVLLMNADEAESITHALATEIVYDTAEKLNINLPDSNESDPNATETLLAILFQAGASRNDDWDNQVTMALSLASQKMFVDWLKTTLPSPEINNKAELSDRELAALIDRVNLNAELKTQIVDLITKSLADVEES